MRSVPVRKWCTSPATVQKQFLAKFKNHPLAVLAALESSLVQTMDLPVTVDCSQNSTRGKIIPIPSVHPIRICTEVDADRAVQLLMKAF